MSNISIDQLQQAVEGLHDCRAAYKETIAVKETHENETVWDGDVFVFELEGHPTAQIAYSWQEPSPGSDKMRFFAVLHEGPIKSAADAVRASIVKDYREGEEK